MSQAPIRDLRNREIRARFKQLRSESVKPDDAYEQIAREFFAWDLTESTVRNIVSNLKYGQHLQPKRSNRKARRML